MAEIAKKLDEAMKLDTAALEAAKGCLADAMSWGCEPADALGSAIVEYLAATRHVSDEAVDDVAARLWKAEAEDAGAPASVAIGRTPDVFREQSEDLKARWRKFARAALAHTGKPTVKPLAWLIEGEDERGQPTMVAVEKDPTGTYGPNMPIIPLYPASAFRATESVLPADVVGLVIAARYVMDQGDMSDDHRRLDRALEAFSSRVRYGDEPDAALQTGGENG